MGLFDVGGGVSRQGCNMKTYKTITPVPHEIVDSMFCDLCRTEAPRGEDWTSENYAVAETTIEIKEGYNSPSGGNYDVISADICPLCFKNKIIPALVELGVRFDRSEVDW